jgi:DNA-binding XRE family transcriptional regulator
MEAKSRRISRLMLRLNWMEAAREKRSVTPTTFPRPPRRYASSREADPTLYRLTQALVAARMRARLSQSDVATRMRTTKSAISRLENGLLHRPTLTTIENYAQVVGCRVEIRLIRQ